MKTTTSHIFEGSRLKDLMLFQSFNKRKRSSCPSACQEHMLSGSIAPSIRNLSTRSRWVVIFICQPPCLQGKSPQLPLNRRLDGLHSQSECSGEKSPPHQEANNNASVMQSLHWLSYLSQFLILVSDPTTFFHSSSLELKSQFDITTKLMAEPNHSRNITLITRMLPTEGCIIYLPQAPHQNLMLNSRGLVMKHPVDKTKVTIL